MPGEADEFDFEIDDEGIPIDERRRRIEARKEKLDRLNGYQRILGCLRQFDAPGITSREIASITNLRHYKVEGWLQMLRKRGEVTCHTKDESRENKSWTWWIPKKVLRAHAQRMKAQSAEAATHFLGWTTSAICARMKAGMEIYSSYPYCTAPVESSSSTTTPLT